MSLSQARRRGFLRVLRFSPLFNWLMASSNEINVKHSEAFQTVLTDSKQQEKTGLWGCVFGGCVLVGCVWWLFDVKLKS